MKKTFEKRLENLRTGWYIWLFPLFAISITAWFLNDYYRQQGPRIFISFEDAGSIQAEKTKVRFRGVPIGTVQDVKISDDQKSVVAEVLLRKDAENIAVEGSKFSLVTPKVGFQGISGLDTLFEGSYIAVLPGPIEAAEKHEFKGQSNSSTDPLDDTSAYVIETSNVESISDGVSVSYRGMKIGTVTKMHFAKGGQHINVQINIDNKYTWLIRTNSVFWRKVGVSAKLGLFGSELKVNSMESIMNGGVEVGTPAPAGPMAKSMQKFTLAPAVPKDIETWNAFLD